MSIEAKLKHARKQMHQRAHKPMAKHAAETMKPPSMILFEPTTIDASEQVREHQADNDALAAMGKQT